MGRPYKGIRTNEGKVCTSCGQLKSFDEYRKSARDRDGLTYNCRDCLRRKERKTYRERYTNHIRKRRNELKRKYVEKMGDQCFRCGYSEFVSGFDFHHTENKENQVAILLSLAANALTKDKIADLEYELSKCILLCSNCHRALHASEWAMSDETYTNRKRFEPEIRRRTDELDNLPLFEKHN